MLFSFYAASAQQINLDDKDDIVDLLSKKEFKVGEYGKVVFKYDEYDKKTASVKFKVDFYPANRSKKNRKVELTASIVQHDGFYIQNYYREISLIDSDLFFNQKYDFPTRYLLFENGELYYMDKIEIPMKDYIKMIMNGQTAGTPRYKLCDK